MSTDGMKIIGIIPARAGSKRLARKNILPLAGKPMIQWTIEAAKEAGCFAKIVVTSDDPGALQVARTCGVTPLVRPAELSTDTATSENVVDHAITVHATEGEHFDAVVLLQPTSPLRTAEDIRVATELFAERSAGSVVSVCRAEHPPEWMTTIPDDRALAHFYATLRRLPRRSQDLPIHYRLNGALYIARMKRFLEERSFYCDPGYAYVMPPERSIDVDTELHLMECEALIKARI